MKIFLFLCLLASVEAFAGPGKVIVKGSKEPCCIYNSERARERRVFMPAKEGPSNEILLPEKDCKDLFYLIVGTQTSWIRVQPDETVTVNVGKKPWKFSGDEAAVNNYLYHWTQKMYIEKPNSLVLQVENMFTQLPRGIRTYPEGNTFFTPEYLAWVKQLLPTSLADLDKAGITDERFVAEQKKRIQWAWWELQLLNYQRTDDNVNIPASAMEFVKTIEFDNEQLLNYPGLESIMNISFDVLGDHGWLTYNNKDFLLRKAEKIKNPIIRETFVLNELNSIITRGQYVYQTAEVLKFVENLILSEQGKQRYAAYQAEYLKQKSESQDGKQIYRFEFQDKNGDTIRPADFVGKFLFIDIWATWCGPCKYQIPHVIKLEKELKGRDIEFLSISVDKPADKQKWLDMLKEFGLEGHCAISPDAFKHEMFELYKVNSIPRFILVNPEGKIIFTRGRRPSDPVLKMQLLELLDEYEKNKSVVTGNLPEFEGQNASFMLPGGMYTMLGGKTIKNGRFDINIRLEKPAFVAIAVDRKFTRGWVKPGDRVNITWKDNFVFGGDNADLNNMMVELTGKYTLPQLKRGMKFTEKHAEQLVAIYNNKVADIEKSQLSSADKKLLIGYQQGELLSGMFGTIASSKVFGKSYPKPVVEKGYTKPILKFQPSFELVNYASWLDGLQEFLYAQMDAGKVKIKSSDTRLADMAQGLTDADLREAYIMETLRLEILRGHLVGAKQRIEAVRPFVKKTENIQKLNEMPKQIVQGEQRYKNALPGTDLSAFSFKNEKGNTISLGDFKGKYIFIDLWSTGCNPCVGEIPYIKEMEHRFAGKPIAWVSISLDLDEKVWKDFLIAQKMTGVQLLCDKGFKHPFIQQIGLTGIPRFMLLDKEGKVLDYSTLRPSSPILGEEIDFLLKGK